jgi:hypothetical protein
MNAISNDFTPADQQAAISAPVARLLDDAGSKLLQYDSTLAGIDRVIVHEMMDEAHRLNSHCIQTAVDEISSVLSIVRRDIAATYDLLNLDAAGIAEKYGDRSPAPVASVAKHVDIANRREWDAALAEYRNAEALSGAASRSPGSDSDALAGRERQALQKLAHTRAPDLQALLIKVVALDLGEAWHTDGVINDVMIDIEALANRAAQAEC